MDIGPELTPNDHAQGEAPSHSKKRSKINGATEAPPAKRIKLSKETVRPPKLPRVPRTPRASTTRTRAAKLGNSNWFTVVPSIAHQVPSDLVLVDTRPRLWSTNRAELGSAFVEISESKCINGISWTLTDMPIVILDNESMALEKPKDGSNELSMDLVLIREFRYANPNTLQKDEESIVDNLSLSQPKDDSRPVHSLAVAPSMIGETPDGPPMREFPLPIPIAECTTITLSPIPAPISESKPGEILQGQGTATAEPANESLSKIPPRAPQKQPPAITTEAHPDPTLPLLTENPVSQSKQGRQPRKAPQETADERPLKPVQDASQSEELESSKNDSVAASSIEHESVALPDTSSTNTSEPKRRRGRPRKVQCKPPAESVLDPEKAVSRNKGQVKPFHGPSAVSTQTRDPSKPTVISTTKSKRENKLQAASQKSTSKAFLDAVQDVSRSRERENDNEPIPVLAQMPDPLNTITVSTPQVKQGRQQEMSRKPANGSSDPVQGVSRLEKQKKPNNETQAMATPTHDHMKSKSTATSNPGTRNSIQKLRKPLGLSTDETLPEQSNTLTLASRSITGLRSKGVKGKARGDSEKPANEPLKSGPLRKSEHEGAQRSQKATKGSSKRARSPGLPTSTPAYRRRFNSAQKERGAPVREHRSKCAAQLSQKKEPEKPIKKSLPSAIRTPSELWGGSRNSVYTSLRFTKKKDTAIDTPIAKISDNNTEASQPSVPAPSPVSAFAPAQPASIIEDARGPPNEHLHRNSYSNKGALSQCTPDIPMSDLENIMREQTDLNPLFHHYPDNRNLPDLNKFMQNFAESCTGNSGVMFQGPTEAVEAARQHVLSESATQQIRMISNHSVPTTFNLQPEQGRQKESDTHPRPPTLSTGAVPSLRFEYTKAPSDILIPGTSETPLTVPQSCPEERRVHLSEHSLRHYTTDRSMSDLENIIRGQEGHFEPVFGHYPNNRLLPNFNRLPLAFADKYGTPLGVQVAPGDIVNIEGRTRNWMDTGRDESRAGKIVGSVETCQGWRAGWEPPRRNRTPMGRPAERRTPWRDSYLDEFVASQARFGSEIRRAGRGCRDVPLAHIVHRASRRVGHFTRPRDPRARTHSPVPTSPRITVGFDKRSRSVPYSKPPPLGPRSWLRSQMSNSITLVMGASGNQVVALSNSRNLSPTLQSIRSESAVTIAQTQSSLTPATPSTKDVTMISLPHEFTPPVPSTQPLQSIAPDDTSLTDQMYTQIHTFLSPATSSANDITMGMSADEPPLPASSASVPIEQLRVSTVPSHAPEISAAMDISMEIQADKLAPSISSTEPLPLSTSTTALLPYLKRKGKEKALAPEDSDDESPTMQDEVRQAKKAKLWHDPVIDVSRILGNPSVSMACSSKTKLEDLPVPQSSRFPQIPAQTGAMVVEDQLPSLSISSSPMKPAKRRGRPPKSAKVASSSSDSAKRRQPPLVSSSVSNSTRSSQAPHQISVMAVEDQSPSSLSVATKPAKQRRRLSHAAKIGPSCSAPALSVTSGSTLDELPSISGSLPKSPTKLQAESSLTPAAPVQWRENGVPLPIPIEIQALVDAYINGVPIGVFASSSHIQGFWGLKLTQGEEIGYAFMGFYRVCRVLESLDEGEVYDGENEKDKKGKGKAVDTIEVSKTRVRWRFKLRWEPGGEGWQIRDPQRLTSPWWNSNLKAQELAVVPRNNSEDSDDESTQSYRLARRGNQNFSRRHCYFDQTFCSVLPLHLLAPINAEIPDAVLPRGWHCPDCGKLNFRYYLRHQRCDSSYCQDKPVAQGYMVEVDRLRDPQDGTPLSLPLNSVPEHIRANSRIQVWNDKMKTLIYCIETGIVGGMARIQHIFTCNLVDLQRVPSELFNSIQMDVSLRRPTWDAHASPYFVHSVDEVRGKGEDSSSWVTAPQCLHRTKEVMNSRGSKYGKKTAAELDINKLIIRAWVTSGSKRGSDLLQAKERCIVVMCLGCEVILSISPKSAMPLNGNQTRLPDLDKLIPMESLDPQEDQLTKSEPEPAESVKLELGEKESQLHLVSPPSTTREVMGKNQKGEKVEMTLSLLHGDVVLLEGDDFEYSIKRTGTSILLFGL